MRSLHAVVFPGHNEGRPRLGLKTTLLSVTLSGWTRLQDGDREHGPQTLATGFEPSALAGTDRSCRQSSISINCPEPGGNSRAEEEPEGSAHRQPRRRSCSQALTHGLLWSAGADKSSLPAAAGLQASVAWGAVRGLGAGVLGAERNGCLQVTDRRQLWE